MCSANLSGELYVAIHVERYSKKEARFVYLLARQEMSPWQTSEIIPLDQLRELLRELNNSRERLQRTESDGLDEDDIKSINDKTRALFSRIKPEGGLERLMRRGEVGGQRALPRFVFSVRDELDLQIPWEMWRLRCRVCLSCGLYYWPERASGCSGCGNQLTRTRVPLFECAQLSHIPVEGSRFEISDERDGFLIVYGEHKPLPEAEVRAHIKNIETYLRVFYDQDKIRIIHSFELSLSLLKRELKDSSYRGLYYFGHAESGRLKLYMNDSLSAQEIAQLAPKIPFVFINACSAGKAHESQQSLASAFAGKDKLVITPTITVGAKSAMLFADAFFSGLVESSQAQSPSHALSYAYRTCAKASPTRIAGVYRRLGALRVSWTPELRAQTPRHAGIILTDDSTLDLDRFQFDLGSVLNAAFESQRLTTVDRPGTRPLEAWHLLAGLLAKGPLTQRLVRELVIDPDALLVELCALRGAQKLTLGTAASAFEHPASSERFFRSDPLGTAVMHTLFAASHAAFQRGAERATERDVLAALLENKQLVEARIWSIDVSAEDLRASLSEGCRSDLTADQHTGELWLGDLSPTAQNLVLGVAERMLHSRKQHNPNERVEDSEFWLAAFLDEADGCAVRCLGQQPRRVTPSMVLDCLSPDATSGERSGRTGSRVVAAEVAPAILPLLRMARALGHRQISTHLLFTVFCRSAPTKFKERLQTTFDLNKASCICLGQRATHEELTKQTKDFFPDLGQRMQNFDQEAQAVVFRFWQLANDLNSYSHRVMLAAFLDQEDKTVAKRLRSFARHSIRKELSEYLAERSRLPNRSDNFERRLSDTIHALFAAVRQGTDKVEMRDLLDAYRQNCPASFLRQLEHLPVYEWRFAL